MTHRVQLKKNSILLLVVIGTFLVISSFFGGRSADAAGTDAGKTLLEQKCVLCHPLDRVATKGATNPSESDWKALVDRMKNKGCPVTDQEVQEIVSYLTATYAKDSATATAAPAASPTPTADAVSSTTSASANSTAVEATPAEQAQTGAEDWIFPLVGLGMIFSGFYLRRRSSTI